MYFDLRLFCQILLKQLLELSATFHTLLLDSCCFLYYTRKSDSRKDTQRRVEKRAQAKREMLQAIKNIISRVLDREIIPAVADL